MSVNFLVGFGDYFTGESLVLGKKEARKKQLYKELVPLE